MPHGLAVWFFFIRFVSGTANSNNAAEVSPLAIFNERCPCLKARRELENAMVTQKEKAERFRALHQREGAFIITNPWDAGSARLLGGWSMEVSDGLQT